MKCWVWWQKPILKNKAKISQNQTQGKNNYKEKIKILNLPLIIDKSKENSKEICERMGNAYETNLLSFDIDQLKSPKEIKTTSTSQIINKNDKMKKRVEIDVNCIMKNVKNNITNLHEQIDKIKLENKDLFEDGKLFESKDLILLKKEIILLKQQLEYYRKKSEYLEYVFFSTKNTIDTITCQTLDKEFSM